MRCILIDQKKIFHGPLCKGIPLDQGPVALNTVPQGSFIDMIDDRVVYVDVLVAGIPIRILILFIKGILAPGILLSPPA